MELKNRTVCFSGHRKIPPENLKTVARRLKEILIELIDKGYLYFGASVSKPNAPPAPKYK